MNETRQPFPRDTCVHQLIAAQVVRTPDAIALIYQQTQLTYRQLNEGATAMANYLQQLGVGPETRVGIMMKKSPAMVMAVLGILAAGGAYVPIHLASPPERIAFILKEANASIFLTNIYSRCIGWV